MFGFLNPRPHPAEYRRAYARLCQHQRRAYGLWSLPFHSYEAVFLYQCAADAGAFPAAVMPAVRCCRLDAPTSLPRDPDAAVGRFCASVALLLGSIKLEDDVRDTRGLLARAARWVLRRRIAKARAYFARLDPRFARNVEQLLADHHQMEARGGPVPLDEYVEPTALAFGYVFGLLARLPAMAGHRETLAAVGRHLGAAIIAYDCAVDWTRDRRRGEFNPLPDEESVLAAMAYSANRLEEAEVQVRRAFGPDARVAATLAAVRARVLRRNPLGEPTPCPVHARGGAVRRAARFVLFPAMAMAGQGGGNLPSDLPGDLGGEVVRSRRQSGNSAHNCAGCDCGPCCLPDCGTCGGDGGGCDCGGCDCNCG